MRKIVAGFAASIDGYIEGPNGEVDWILIDEKMDFADYFRRFDAFFFGRKTYEKAVAMFSKPAKGITNYVFSNTLTEVDQNFVLVGGNVRESVEALRQQEGKDIALYGGASLLASFLNWQLVDEITASFIPVLLGAGKPMVDVLQQRVELEFRSSRRYANGTLMINYGVKYALA
jgi:dihydrofolate reductase